MVMGMFGGAGAGGGGMASDLARAAQSVIDGDDESKLSALNELCDLLARSSEAHLARAGIDLEALVQTLVTLMRAGHSNMMMLLAARTLEHMMDAMPPVCRLLARHGAINVLCEKLTEIGDIDLAEQAMKCLDMLSVRHASMVLEAGGLSACLGFRDFFAITVQQRAVTIATRAVEGATRAQFAKITEAAPMLVSLLAATDERISLAGLRLFEKLRPRMLLSLGRAWWTL